MKAGWAPAALATVLASAVWVRSQPPRAAPPQATPPILATISGASVTLTGGPAELDALGRLRVPDGATIDLAGATARLDLIRGGTIAVCGPARLSLAVGGHQAFLVSIEQGALNLRYASPVADSLLTPDFRITTVVPPDQLATVSANLSLQSDGDLCLMNHGSALAVERLQDGSQQYVINGQGLELRPGSPAVAVASCPCASPPPVPVPPAPNSAAGAAGPLFPQQPALTVNGAEATAPATPPVAAVQAPPTRHHNPVVRFLRWLVGKRN